MRQPPSRLDGRCGAEGEDVLSVPLAAAPQRQHETHTALLLIASPIVVLPHGFGPMLSHCNNQKDESGVWGERSGRYDPGLPGENKARESCDEARTTVEK